MKLFDDLVDGVETDIGRHDAQKLWLMLTAGDLIYFEYILL